LGRGPTVGYSQNSSVPPSLGRGRVAQHYQELPPVTSPVWVGLTKQLFLSQLLQLTKTTATSIPHPDVLFLYLISKKLRLLFSKFV